MDVPSRRALLGTALAATALAGADGATPATDARARRKKPLVAAVARVVEVDLEIPELIRFQMAVVARGIGPGQTGEVVIGVTRSLVPASADRMRAELVAAVQSNVAANIGGDPPADRVSVLLI